MSICVKQQRNWVCACLETAKTNHLEGPLSKFKWYQISSSGQLYFNHDAFSCAMVLLIIFLSKTRVNFIYVNITDACVAELILAEATSFQHWNF